MEVNNDFSKGFLGIWIPLELLKIKDLKHQELILLSMISNLQNEKGCYASNKYLGNILNLSKGRVSCIINSLKNRGYIRSFINKDKGNVRRLFCLIDTSNPTDKL